MDGVFVGVIGAGTMGSGIAHVCGLSGYNTVMVDVDRAVLEKGMDSIKENLRRQAARGIINAHRMDEALDRITAMHSLDDLKKCSIVIEAIVEKAAVKKDLFSRLSSIVDRECILATNTSTISITEIAASAAHPDRVIGMHFMNPAPVMQLVEVVRGLQTSDRVFQAVMTAAKRMDKTPVGVNDSPGFVSNRILMPMINEAICVLQEGVADAEAIDTVMKLGMNHPMGPLVLADFIGLDVCLFIMEVLHQDFGDTKYRPAPLLRRMVAAGYLGRKSKRGFYTY
jgi:3-hydroxybutyryl-CoA dehydrogenase